MRLHLQHHARVGLGEGVAVRDSPAGNPQLHFGQAWRADEAQGGLGGLVDVAHAGRALGGWNGTRGQRGEVRLTEKTLDAFGDAAALSKHTHTDTHTHTL